MICKSLFVKTQKYCYCDNPELIENYDKAISDTTQTWSCHHKLEAFYRSSELKAMGRYWHVSPRELVFVKEKGKCYDRTSHYFWLHKARTKTKEWIENAAKNRINRTPSEEVKKKISEKLKGRKLSEETKAKMRGRTPWNKGRRA